MFPCVLQTEAGPRRPVLTPAPTLPWAQEHTLPQVPRRCAHGGPLQSRSDRSGLDTQCSAINDRDFAVLCKDAASSLKPGSRLCHHQWSARDSEYLLISARLSHSICKWKQYHQPLRVTIRAPRVCALQRLQSAWRVIGDW